MRVDARGLTFDVDVTGPDDGEPVLLLHGFPQNRTMWAPVAGRLHAAGLRTIAMDQRGYSRGARPAAVSAYEIGECAADLLAVLDELAIGSAHVVAHDWGALAAWFAAQEAPSRVRTLTAVSACHPAAYADALRSDLRQRAASWYISLFRRPGVAEAVLSFGRGSVLRLMLRGVDEPARYVEPLLERGALTAALNWYRAISTERMAALGPVTCPVTYVWSDGDPALSRATAQRCAAHVTGPYESVELTRVSHWIPDEAPDAVASAALRRICAHDAA